MHKIFYEYDFCAGERKALYLLESLMLAPYYWCIQKLLASDAVFTLETIIDHCAQQSHRVETSLWKLLTNNNPVHPKGASAVVWNFYIIISVFQHILQFAS